jgi:addiction module RelE/StbE family toxin
MKRHRVEWTRRALRDLDEIHAYVAADDPGIAARVARTILVAADNLSLMPARGRPGRAAGTRELILSGWPWMIVYRIAGDRVQVLAVRHGARER